MSQSWSLSDVLSWDDDQYHQHLVEAVSIVTNALNNGDHFEETLNVLVTKLIPLNSIETLEARFFSKVFEKVQVLYAQCVEGVLELLTETQNAQHLLCKQLQKCESIVSSLEVCLSNLHQRIPKDNPPPLSAFHSMYLPVVQIISCSYQHCKESGTIYGGFLGQISEILSVFFKKAHSLHMNLLALFEAICQKPISSSNDVEDFCSVILGLHDISRIASSLDIKIMVNSWKAVSSAGQDEDTFVTDFAVYKIITILTVYLPMMISTFLLSQEYLGDKIACFAPENFTEPQAEALHEYCWTNGYWISEGTAPLKSLYTQPHRYYPLYLPLQVIITMSPVILWNVMAKNQLLAILRATEEFFEDLLEMLSKGEEEEEEENTRKKVISHMRQFHETCVSACKTSRLARIAFARVVYETLLTSAILLIQFQIYDHQEKTYHCRIPELYPDEIMCTVPMLDLLDMIWSINVSCLIISLLIDFYALFMLYRIHFLNYQPMFFNQLPYGDTDDFNETVEWDDLWVKDSYILLTRIFMENNPIMTKSFVLQAMKPALQEKNKNIEPDQSEEATEEGANGVVLKAHKLTKKESIYENALDTLAESEDSTDIFNDKTGKELHNGESNSRPVIVPDSIGRLRHRVTISTRLKPVQGVVAPENGNLNPNLKDYSVLGLVLMVIPLFLMLL